MYGITFDRKDGRKRINFSKPVLIIMFLLACLVFVVTLLSTVFAVLIALESS